MKHLDSFNCKDLRNYFCDTCSVAKQHNLPFMPSSSITENACDLIYIDLWEPYSVKAITGATYYLTIVDDHSRVTSDTLVYKRTCERDYNWISSTCWK